MSMADKLITVFGLNGIVWLSVWFVRTCLQVNRGEF